MFKHIVYIKNAYFIRKWTLRGWLYWDRSDNEWYKNLYNGMEDYQSLLEVWKARRHKFVQFI